MKQIMQNDVFYIRTITNPTQFIVSHFVTEHWTGMSTVISRAVLNVLIVNSVNEPLTRPELRSLLNRIQCR